MNSELKPNSKVSASSLPRFQRGLGVGVYSNKFWIYVGNKKAFVGPGGLRVLQLLRGMYAQPHRKFSLGSLRRVTKKIRTIDVNNEGRKGVRKLLNLLIEYTLLEDRRRLFIWLRGRLGGQSGTEVMARFSNHPNWRTRKEVARALKRLHAWAELRTMHEQEQHWRVRNLSRQVPAPSFGQRLSDFCQSVKQIETSPTFSSSLFIDESVSLSRKLPKSLERLHRLLLRISNRVRSTKSAQ